MPVFFEVASYLGPVRRPLRLTKFWSEANKEDSHKGQKEGDRVNFHWELALDRHSIFPSQKDNRDTECRKTESDQ